MNYIKKMYLFFNTLRFLPHILLFIFSLSKEKIEKDVERWSKRFCDASFEEKDKMMEIHVELFLVMSNVNSMIRKIIL